MDGALLMNRKQAAEALNMSLSHFQRHVQDGLPCVPTDQLRLYWPVDLRRWIDTQLLPPREISGPIAHGTPEACDPFTSGFGRAHEKFIQDCRAGVALNNRGRPYKPKAILSLGSALPRVPGSIRRRRLVDVAGFELQHAIHGFICEGLSAPGSTPSSALCAPYIYGRSIAAGPRSARRRAYGCRRSPRSRSNRIATPGEFAELLDSIPAEHAPAWAIAGYATARHQEIEALDWTDVDFGENAILLGGDDEARKSEAARRIVPMVKQLRARMRAQWERQERPQTGPIFKPKRADNKSGTADLNAALRRITKKWTELDLEPISFQDSRHTAATWLDHAGVSPKVASVIMDHKAPKLRAHPDAAPIRLRRYTHVLEDELGMACDRLESFLSRREVE